jgi:hypothetical protein
MKSFTAPLAYLGRCLFVLGFIIASLVPLFADNSLANNANEPWVSIGNAISARQQYTGVDQTYTWFFRNDGTQHITGMKFNYIDSLGSHPELLLGKLDPGGTFGGWAAYTSNGRVLKLIITEIDTLEGAQAQQAQQQAQQAQQQQLQAQQQANEQRQQQLADQRQQYAAAKQAMQEKLDAIRQQQQDLQARRQQVANQQFNNIQQAQRNINSALNNAANQVEAILQQDLAEKEQRRIKQEAKEEQDEMDQQQRDLDQQAADLQAQQDNPPPLDSAPAPVNQVSLNSDYLTPAPTPTPTPELAKPLMSLSDFFPASNESSNSNAAWSDWGASALAGPSQTAGISSGNAANDQTALDDLLGAGSTSTQPSNDGLALLDQILPGGSKGGNAGQKNAGQQQLDDLLGAPGKK